MKFPTKIAPILILSLTLCLASTTDSLTIPQNPVIGIFTQTLNTSHSYIAASYVKFIEMSGAQVVPILAFSPTSQILALLPKLNGVLFPGGGMQFSMTNLWTKNADAVFKYAVEQNDKGNKFPLWGTCLGFQLLSFLTSNYNSSILTRVHDDEAVIHPLTFVNDGYIFSTLSTTQKTKLTKGSGIVYFNHNWAVSIETYNSNILLKNFWTITYSATTLTNQKFIAAWESNKYPFYGVQFHPEKNNFQWKVLADRSLQAIQVPQIISNQFVEIARKSPNRFASASEFTNLSIYNYRTEPTTMSFTQIYTFKETTSTATTTVNHLQSQ